MTLDPVHLDGIAALARRIGADVDEADHRDLAVEAWREFLDPLYDGGEVVLEPMDALARRAAPAQDLALRAEPFDSVHGLDSGTMNPRTFRNGLVLDVAQAAMSASPSQLDLHRSRTVVVSVHSNDATVAPAGDDWDYHDERYVRQRIIKAPPVDRYEKVVVHALSLYLAESQHALRHADDVPEFLLLDGPVYPKGILHWHERGTELRDLLAESDLVHEVLENYVRLVETFDARDVPLAGFVKNTSSRALTNLLGEKTVAPWANDVAFFTRVLERRDDDGGRPSDELAWTNWFRSRLGADAVFADGGPGVEMDLDLALDPSAYEVCFFVVYDPRTDVGFKVELPRAFAEDEGVREAVERHVLAGVAAERGPPPAVGKADALARVGRADKETLVRRLEDEFDTRRQRDYDDERWGERG